jgi:hypothetical protein
VTEKEGGYKLVHSCPVGNGSKERGNVGRALTRRPSSCCA